MYLGGEMQVEYKQEFLFLVQDEVQPLAELEWEESGHPTKELCIDWHTYTQLEDLGKLRFYTARVEGKLIGYFVVLVAAPLTTIEVVGCYDSVYVHPDYRKSRVFMTLLKFVEKCLKDEGVTSVVASSSEKNPIDKLLSRVGYSPIETKHEKVL